MLYVFNQDLIRGGNNALLLKFFLRFKIFSHLAAYMYENLLGFTALIIFFSKFPRLSWKQILKNKYEPGAHPEQRPKFPVYEWHHQQEHQEDNGK